MLGIIKYFKKLNVLHLLVVVIAIASILRLYKLSVNPPSMFGDELDLGYHAYSILKTGRDYQGNFMPLNFHSLAEWRTPLYLYSAVPTVAIFGLTPLGVRLPAAIFGIMGIYVLYLLVEKITKNQKIGLVAALLLAISPWHLQYSRAGFEVTEMSFFLMLGVYFLLKSLEKNNFLWLSVLAFTLTPWIYSTSKFFTPIFVLVLFLIYKKEILSFSKPSLYKALITGMVVGLPLLYGIFFGGGTQRFNYISVFADPTTEAEVGYSRTQDARARGETGTGLSPQFSDRFIHNKFTFWGSQIVRNYLKSFSTEFLFIKGDPDPRHSVGIGELYKLELVALLVGIIFFFTSGISAKSKALVVSWIALGPIPASLTKDGGDHATRLILMLPPLLLLVSFGWYELFTKINKHAKWILALGLFVTYALSLVAYLHEYYIHYPSASERWWHYGWGQAISEIKKIDANYQKVVISMSGEPAWIFFAGYYQYDPATWQKNYPIGNDVELSGFGKVSHTGKYYFGSPEEDIQIYGISKYMDSDTLYLANAKEVGENLLMHPEKTPSGLKLVRAIPFVSGEPAFYLFEIND